MSKPSIFSKDYEKLMKKRKRKIIIFCFLGVCVIGGITARLIYKPINFTEVKNNLQAWVDSDTEFNTLADNTDNKGAETIPETEEYSDSSEKQDESALTDEMTEDVDAPVPEDAVSEETSADDNSFMELTLNNGNVIKASYSENDGEKKFVSAENLGENESFDISEDGKHLLVSDSSQDIMLFNIEGESQIISKDRYISTKGGIFTKENTLAVQPDYLWNAQPKFLDNDSIIYITNRPYFGSAANNEYLWITNITDGSDRILWELAAETIEMGDKTDDGQQVMVDGENYYIARDGSFIQ